MVNKFAPWLWGVCVDPGVFATYLLTHFNKMAISKIGSDGI